MLAELAGCGGDIAGMLAFSACPGTSSNGRPNGPQNARLTAPLVRDSKGESLRPATWDEALDAPQPASTRPWPPRGRKLRHVRVLEEATNEVNFIAQKFTRVAIGATTSIAAIAPDTPSVVGLATVFGAGGGTSSVRRRGASRRRRAVGLERSRDASDLLPSRARGRPTRRQAVRGRSEAYDLGALGRRPSAARVGTDIALANAVARDPGRRPRAPGSSSGDATSGFEASAPMSPPGPSSAASRRPASRRRSSARSRMRRDRAARHDLLDARHHRAPQRGRQRPRAHQPGAALRARRPVRLGA